MSKVYTYCFLTVLLFSCQHELENVVEPANLIPADTFEMILEELMLVEAFTRSKHSNVHDYYQIMQRSGHTILDNKAIDTMRFEISMNYYAQKQEVLVEMYEAILERTLHLLHEEDN